MIAKLSLFIVMFCQSFAAQARPVEAYISCSCASWKMSPSGDMKLSTESVGASMFAEVSDAFSTELRANFWYQHENTKQGYASVTPGFLQSRSDYQTIFKRGPGSLDYIVEICKKNAEVAGNVACGVSVTFPINENALAEFQK